MQKVFFFFDKNMHAFLTNHSKMAWNVFSFLFFSLHRIKNFPPPILESVVICISMVSSTPDLVVFETDETDGRESNCQKDASEKAPTVKFASTFT